MWAVIKSVGYDSKEKIDAYLVTITTAGILDHWMSDFIPGVGFVDTHIFQMF